MSAQHASLSRRIGRGCRIRISSLDAELTLRPARTKDSDWTEPLVLAGQFGAIELAKATRLLRALSGIDLGDAGKTGGNEGSQGDDANEHRGWLVSALLGRLADTPFSAVDRIERARIKDPNAAVVVCITLQTPAHAIVAHARAGADVWLKFLQGGAWRRDRLPQSVFLGLPICQPIILARHDISGDALDDLREGDVIVPANPEFGFRGAGFVDWDTLRGRVRFNEPRTLKFENVEAKVTSIDNDGGYDDSDSDFEPLFDNDAEPKPSAHGEPRRASAPADAADPGLDKVHLTLEFELGQVRMSLGELRTLGEGAVLPLLGGSPDTVAIRCNGRQLGLGEIVAVNNQLGIRVTAWGTP
jgi:type III secretion protein Q